MTTDTNNPNHIIADEGKVFRRIADNLIFGDELWLGKTYYLGGEALATPKDESPEDYEEIDKPQEADDDLITEEMPLVDETEAIAVVDEGEEATEATTPRTIKVADYVALESKVEELTQAIALLQGKEATT